MIGGADQTSAATLQELLELRKRVEESERRAADYVSGAQKVGLFRAVPWQGDFGTESNWLELIQSAVERVDLMGRALYGWAESSSAFDVIVQKIQRDQVAFRWLVMSPANPYLENLTESDTKIGSDIQSKIKVLCRFLAGVRNALPENMRGLLQVRFFDQVPLYFGYLRVDERFFVTQYMLSANSGSSPMYCLENLNAAWPKAYAREFEAIWRSKSKTLGAEDGGLTLV